MDLLAPMNHPDVFISVTDLLVPLAAVRTLESRLFSALVPIMRRHAVLLAERAVAFRAHEFLMLVVLGFSLRILMRHWKKRNRSKSKSVQVSKALRCSATFRTIGVDFSKAKINPKRTTKELFVAYVNLCWKFKRKIISYSEI